MKELWQLTAHEANKGLRSRDFSSVELTNSVLERLNSVEPEMNAFITITEETALVQAKEADKRFAAGTATALTGIPMGIKDLIITKGTRTTAGSQILSEFVPPYNSHVNEKLERLRKKNLKEQIKKASTICRLISSHQMDCLYV